MLCLREGVLFTAPMSIASAFTGFHLGANVENDGANFSRKVGLIKVVTNPTDGDTLIVGGKTYTFKNTALLATHIKIGNLVTNGDFAGAGASWINYGGWTIDATGALHTAGPTSGVIASFADYRATVGGAVLVTDTAHGLVTGNIVTIAGTTNYNGTYTIVKVGADTFYIIPQNGWMGTETGTWSTTASTHVLDQEWFPKVVVGYTYATSFTISAVTAGTVKIKIGGVLGEARSTVATFTESIVALTDGPLEFVPSADFDGKISAVTVTNTLSDLKTMTAKAICGRINLDKVTALVTAYQGYNSCGLTTEIALVAETVGVTPTVTPDGARITKPIAMALVLTQAQLENTDYWKKNITSEVDVKPTVLVERNSGTDRNFLY